MTRATVAIIFVLCLLASAAWAADEWKDEFKRLCNYTDVAHSLSDADLKKLVVDSDVLLGKLKALKEPKVKVYIFRLKKCRNMYQFTLDLRASKVDGKASP